MRIGIMQPYLFPYVGYFQLIHAVDKFVLLDDVNFINKGWINRNKILVNGKENLFTIPLENASQNKLIKDINISSEPKWKGKFLMTLTMAYKKAPFFNDVMPIIDSIMNSEENNISKKIFFSLQKINGYLEIKTIIEESSSKYQTVDLKAEDKIISICKQEKATEYINPIGGTELYDKAKFDSEGIQLYFIKSGAITYKQFSNDFVPYLSIIDLLMFNSNEAIAGFLRQYTLIQNE